MLAAARSTQPQNNRFSHARDVIESSTSLREAFQFLLAIDSRAPAAEVYTKGIAFANRFQELLETPNNEFIKGFFGFCVTARSKEQGLRVPSTELELSRPTGFPDAIWLGVHPRGSVPRYYSPYGAVENDGWGTRAFHRDVCTYVGSIAAEARSQNPLSDETVVKLNEFAANVLVCFRKRVREHSSIAATKADEIATLLQSCDTVTEPMLQILASQLTFSENLPLSKSLPAILKRTGLALPGLTKDAVARATDRARGERPLTLEDLDVTTRSETIHNLSAGVCKLMEEGLAATLELKWMNAVEAPLRSFKFSTYGSSASPLVSLLGATRFQTDALPHLERAMADIARLGLTGLAIEVDHSPFAWPKIAEIVALTKPSSLMIGASADQRQTTPKTISPSFLAAWSENHLPLSLAVGVTTAVEHELLLLSPQEISWPSATEGRCNLFGQTITIQTSEELTTSREVQRLLGLSKPPTFAFSMRDPRCEPLPEGRPYAFGVFFHDLKRDAPGYERLDFGGVLKLFISTQRPEPKKSSSKSRTPTALSEASRPPAHSSSKAVDSKPPPPREQRPTISSDLATVAKVSLLEIPSIQQVARQSNALHPRIPFNEQDVIVTLNILKNGERPGTKSLKALRAYITDEAHFKDCGLRANAVRTALGTIVDQLLAK
jgi:hypothetical protein